MMMAEQPLQVPHNDWLTDLPHNLHIACLNTRSLQRHADNISSNIYHSACDVTIYTESRMLGQAVPQQFRQQQVFCASAPSTHNYVGVAVIVSPHIHASQLSRTIPETFQVITVQVTHGELQVNIAALYRSNMSTTVDVGHVLN